MTANYFHPLQAGILGTGSYLPEKILSNQELEKLVDTSDEWIKTRTGIHERRIAKQNEQTSDMAVEAARKAVKAAKIDLKQIDAIINATITPDVPWPATACLIQKKLGVQKAFALDVSAACSGFLYGLTLAQGLIVTKTAKKVLVIGADKLSAITNYKDRNTCILFGDGAGAVVVGTTHRRGRIAASSLGTDGEGFEKLIQPAGGTRLPASQATLAEGKHFLEMDGKEVFKNAIKRMVESSGVVLRRAGSSAEEVALFIPHQANLRIIEEVAERMKIPTEKVYLTIQKYGNTSSASIPIALDEAFAQGRIKLGDKVLLSSFGAGFTWGSILIDW